MLISMAHVYVAAASWVTRLHPNETRILDGGYTLATPTPASAVRRQVAPTECASPRSLLSHITTRRATRAPTATSTVCASAGCVEPLSAATAGLLPCAPGAGYVRRALASTSSTLYSTLLEAILDAVLDA